MKKILKNIFMIIITIISTIFLGITIVNAEIAANKLTISSSNYYDTPLKFPYTFHIKKTTSGKYVYCTTYAKARPNTSIEYKKSSLVTDNGMNYILNESYKNVNSSKNYFIYQTALWIYMQDKGLYSKNDAISTFKHTVNKSSSTTAKKIRSIVSNAKKASKNDTSAPTIKLSASNVTFSLSKDGKNYVSSKIKLTSSTKSYKVSFSNAPSGTTYKVSRGYLYVYVPANKVTNLKTTFKINVSNSKTVYSSYIYIPNNNNYQKMAATYKTTKTAKDSISIVLNRKVSILVNKVDSTTGTPVSGAKLKVTNSSGKVIDSWTSTTKAHKVSKLSQGTYTISELKAPNGYILNNVSIKFTVDSKGTIKNSNGSKITSITYKNTKNSVKISKQDITTNKELPGASLKLKNASGKVVDSWISTNKAHVIKGLTAGTYTLSETIAPEGYIKTKETITFTINKYGKLTDKNGNSINKVVMYNTPQKEIDVEISKQDITTKKELPGATLVVKDKDGNIIDSWVSTEETHIIKNMKAGTYTLTETIAPNGYELSTKTVKFIIDESSNLVDEKGNSLKKVIMYNTPEKETGIEISKQDITTKKELPGASLTVVDENNAVVDTWVSTDEAHIIKGIKEGTYTLTETQAPDGYILSKETIKFSIDKDGNLLDENGKEIDKVIMYNKKEEKSIKISKQDIDTRKELPGAKLEVKDSSGKVIDSWTSETESHEIKNLAQGTYTLTEIQAPNGYILSAETIKFTIDDKGKLTDDDGKEIDKVIMFNTKIPTTDVKISKQDITTSNELPGASLEVKDSSGKIVDSWVSGTEVHTIKDLAEGTYTLTETIAPNGYILSQETITFKIDSKGQLLNSNDESIDKVIMYNEKEVIIPKVPIVKQDSKTNKNLAGASLEIKDSTGKIIDSWTSTTEAHYVELNEGTYTLTEIKAPKGYILNSTPITFNVTSEGKITDSNGNTINTIIMNNTPEEIITKVSISKQDITNGKELPGAKLVIKDKNGNVIDSWISTDKPHLINGLAVGEYTLNEVVAPNGYILSDETITFTVNADGSLTSVVMYNKPKTVTVPPTTPSSDKGQEIKVENTSSFKNVASSIIGGITVMFGTATIARKIKKREI